MSRWGELIPHREDDESCLCGCQDEPSNGSDGLASEAELEAAARKVLEFGAPRTVVYGDDDA